ncbi:MAG TPA: hypothetical protein VJY31_10750 [Buttiauxella sp.]|nr:hypothetical protein [Buttiauxella sp.]
MHRMNPADGHNLPYWWSTALGVFSLLSLQDYVFILGALISAFFTIKTYYAKRKEEHQRAEEDRARTQLLKKYLEEVRDTPHPDKPRTATVVAESLRMIKDEPLKVE